MARPSPVPPNCRSISASSCVKRWKSWPIFSSAMPIPVSLMAILRRGAACVPARCATSEIVPPAVNLTALLSRLSRICRNLGPSMTARRGKEARFGARRLVGRIARRGQLAHGVDQLRLDRLARADLAHHRDHFHRLAGLGIVNGAYQRLDPDRMTALVTHPRGDDLHALGA